MCFQQYFKSIKIFLIANLLTGKLFLSFGATAKKAWSPSVVWSLWEETFVWPQFNLPSTLLDIVRVSEIILSYFS